MKLNHFALVNASKLDSFGRRKREQHSIRIDAAIKRALDELLHQTHRRKAFLRLLVGVRAHTPLFKPGAGRGTPGWVAPIFLINRLKNLAARERHWIRPCETWETGRSELLRPAFHSLVQHLLTEFPVPRFMDAAWDLPDGPDAFRQ